MRALARLGAAACTALISLSPFATTTASAGDSVWVGLIYATNEKVPTSPPPSLAAVAPKLKKIFGYNQFKLLGEQRRALRNDQSEHWLVPGKPFSLSVCTTGAGPSKTPKSARRQLAPSLGALHNGAPTVTTPIATPSPVEEAPTSFRLQLFQGQKLLVQTGADLEPNSPAFIRGPLYSKGQLILMLEME